MIFSSPPHPDKAAQRAIKPRRTFNEDKSRQSASIRRLFWIPRCDDVIAPLFSSKRRKRREEPVRKMLIQRLYLYTHPRARTNTSLYRERGGQADWSSVIRPEDSHGRRCSLPLSFFGQVFDFETKGALDAAHIYTYIYTHTRAYSRTH